MTDPTENIRKVMVASLNLMLSPDEKERYRELRQVYEEDDIFTTETVQELFEIEGFLAPFVVVRRKSDNVRGSLKFSHSPRFYFGFTPE